jgi:class 3 adenylate cyclase
VQALVVQLFASIAACGFCVAAWSMTSGTFAQAGKVLRNPSLTRQLGFWPMWVILIAGAALVVHLGFVVAQIFSERARRRRRQATQNAAHQAARVSVEVVERSASLLRSLTSKVKASKPTVEPAVPARRWVTVMFVDIVGSTSLAEELGDEEWSRILTRYREFVRAAFAARGGEEVGTQGDGFLAKFPGPADAVLSAVDIQQDIRKVSAAGVPLQVRIGVHAGEAVHDDDGDVIGRVVNLAARVTAEADPSEILVTEPVADFLGERLQLEDRGLRELRGVPQPRHVLAVVWTEPAGKKASRRRG